MKKPTTLIREALQRGAMDLAYTCWQDTTKRVDPFLEDELKALKQTVQSWRYEALENYLKNQQWREADEETYRLMITTVGKEKGQGFSRSDLENFPCEDLRTIDRLWVQYSNGKWGFSVQKCIWEEYGSPIDYDAGWEQFCDRVGWCKEGKWIGDLTYDLQKSPAGEFPALVVVMLFSSRVRVPFAPLSPFFFSRIKSCEL